MALKRFGAVLLACVLLLTAMSGVLTVSADHTPTVTVGTVSAVPGDTVLVNIDIKDNVALMAITVTFHYDAAVLEYTGYHAGFLKDYGLADRKGYISFVNCESEDRTDNGTMLTLEFKVKDDALTGFCPITIKNIWPDKAGDSLKGCFACFEGTKITPTVVAGGVEIKYNGKNCRHKFGQWTDTVAAKCTDNGIQTRVCTACGHNEQRESKPLGHEFAADWTVDREATTEEDGVMSRHCNRCEAVTDRVTFSLPEAEENEFENQAGTQVQPETFEPLKEIQNQNKQPEQKPQEEPEETPTDSPTEESPSQNDVQEGTTAEDLILENKEETVGFFSRFIEYLFGARGNGGIIAVLKEGFLEHAPAVLWKAAAAILSVILFVL